VSENEAHCSYLSLEDARRGSPANQGTFDIQGTQMNFRTGPQDNTFRYRVTLTGNACESMRLVLVSDDRQTHGAGFVIDFTRVPDLQP
jgi:hypothetical protein